MAGRAIGLIGGSTRRGLFLGESRRWLDRELSPERRRSMKRARRREGKRKAFEWNHSVRFPFKEAILSSFGYRPAPNPKPRSGLALGIGLANLDSTAANRLKRFQASYH
jgi:hypothetical protein